MEEIQNKVVKVVVDNNSLAVTKGYGYTNKDGKQRYSYNDVYYQDGERICRKHSNDAGDFYYNVQLVDVVVETFPMKDGSMGSKTYPLSEVPYLAESSDTASEEVLENYLKFKLHR
ncbi:MAG: hypothetical protein IKP77_01310 [Acholeplasmatales bacterium]|nr:hypothetical protein [Acholeplasmatales bacterium]